MGGERSHKLPPQNPDAKCALLVLTDGLEETESVRILCKLRQAGLYVKSVGLTSGLVSGTHGILVKPDLTLADFEPHALDICTVKLIILTQRNRAMSRLETEPRLHQLLLHTLAQGGCLALDAEGQSILKAIRIPADQLKTYRENKQIFIHDRQQSFEVYTDELIRCFDVLPRRRRSAPLTKKSSR